MTLVKYVGKTVKSISPEVLVYGDFTVGLHIEFTDGTELVVTTCGCCGLWEEVADDPDR